MDSRDLLTNTKKVEVLLDTATFNSLITQGDRVALAILAYNGSEKIEFLRTPSTTSSQILQRIPEFGYELTDDGWINGLSVQRTDTTSTFYFGYRMEDILTIAERIFERAEVTEQQFERVLLVFIQATLSRDNAQIANIFITSDNVLLKKRLWFEAHFPGGILNIMSVEEASCFLDIFLKENRRYLVSAHSVLNKGHWYLLSMRLKLPHYNVGDPIIGALSQRFTFILMALDEMGIQFYRGTNNDTMDNTLYHFNYLISLTTGIFDNLALKTNTQLGINHRDPRQVCINNNSGREFLREVRDRNQTIRDHISNYMNFINLMYEFRELVIHREGLACTAFENHTDRWKANFIKVNTEIRDRLRACGDKPSQLDPFTTWGFYQLHDSWMLEPYHFALEATKKLTLFVDRYLELLGFPSFLTSSRTSGDDFADTLNRFEKGHLGF